MLEPEEIRAERELNEEILHGKLPHARLEELIPEEERTEVDEEVRTLAEEEARHLKGE
jgi:hypothetical protein